MNDRKNRRSIKRWNDKFERIYQKDNSNMDKIEPLDTGNKIKEIKKVDRREYDDFLKQEEEEIGEYKDKKEEKEILKRRINFVKPKKDRKEEEEFQESKIQLIEDEKIIKLMKWNKIFKIGSGLNNLGNTCYLNSALQCLCYTPCLNNFLLEYEQKSNGIKNIIEIIRDLFRNMITSNHSSISPVEVVKNLKRIGSFKLGRQEDSHELIIHLLDKMEQNLISHLKLNHKIKMTNPIQKIFGGYFKSQIETESGYISNTYDPFIDLSLSISTVNSVEKAIESFSKPDLLQGENKFKNPKTNQYENAKKTTFIHKLPFQLMIHLKRFSYTGRKISKFIEFKDILNLNQSIYHLYAIIVHSGSSRLSGHYYAFVKAPNQIWYEMNDSFTRQVSIQTVLSQQAYMLFYTRDFQSNINLTPMKSIKPNSLVKSNTSPLVNSIIKSTPPKSTLNTSSPIVKSDKITSLVKTTPIKSTPVKSPIQMNEDNGIILTPKSLKLRKLGILKNETISPKKESKTPIKNLETIKKRKYDAKEMIELNEKGKYQEKIERWDGKEEMKIKTPIKFDEYNYLYDMGKQKKKRKKETIEEFLEENERFKKSIKN